ncbi:transketolase [Brackiella oedipodis]|uniref:transketolase n=1 Tax=Brackiella oedipodis TaxID=124225 RepID=UPI000491E3BE|nr:transketolase [Brackiella oedipodis]
MNTSTDVQPQQLANAIRALSMDAVQKANSGHPGAPMGMADMAVALWTRHLHHNPKNPDWLNRDRFVLSNGHGSMLIYSLLHLTGYDLSIDDLKHFRQLHSKTPGHPEVGVTAGIETTTGPLGQGIANAVGFALAEKLLAQEFNQDGHQIIDHFTYVFTGDGCLMEGVSHEACSFAGTLKLSKLIVLWDDNGISIDGKVQNWFAEDVAKRFEAYGWNVIREIDGHNIDAVDQAIAQAKANAKEADAGPTLICCRTQIGKGSPNKAGSEKVHGAPLGDEEINLTRQALHWQAAAFEVPTTIAQAWDQTEVGQELEHAWQEQWQAYEQAHPELAQELSRRMRSELPADFAKKFEAILNNIVAQAQTVATRKASQIAINAFAKELPEFLGGSADLTGSNLTNWDGVQPVRAHQFGQHINYGVREFGMAAIMNGIALHGGYLPFGGTFLTFSDYSRNAIRMSALMKQRVVHVFTHDSIGLGEDGPTHQAIEHANSLRLIPNLHVWRPCDTTETAVAWYSAVTRPASHGTHVQAGGPSALLLSRQNLPFIERDQATIALIAKGGYIVSPAKAKPQAVLMATGSEVQLVLQAQAQLAKDNIDVQVVSMPCTNLFDTQDADYQAQVIPRDIPALAIEAGSTGLWHKYVGRDGVVLGIDSYGESAPASDLFKHFGLTAEHIVAAVQKLV